MIKKSKLIKYALTMFISMHLFQVTAKVYAGAVPPPPPPPPPPPVNFEIPENTSPKVNTTGTNSYEQHKNDPLQILQEISKILNLAPENKKADMMKIIANARNLNTNQRLEPEVLLQKFTKIQDDNWQYTLADLGITLQKTDRAHRTTNSKYSGLDKTGLQKIRLNALKDAPEDIVTKLNLALTKLKKKSDGQPVTDIDILELIDKIKANGWQYDSTNLWNIKNIESNNSSTNSIPSNYITQFDKNQTYKIQYATKDGIKEKDITDIIISTVREFIQVDRNSTYDDMSKKQTKEKFVIYSKINSIVQECLERELNLDLLKYYYDNIKGEDYKKYFTIKEVSVIKDGFGYKKALEQRKENLTKELEGLQKEFTTQNKLLEGEEFEQKYNQIMQKYGEGREYEVQNPKNFTEKIGIDKYYQIVTDAAKKRAAIMGLLKEEREKLREARFIIEGDNDKTLITDDEIQNFINQINKEQNIDSSIITSLIGYRILEYNHDLTPSNIPISKVMGQNNLDSEYTQNLTKQSRILRILKQILLDPELRKNLGLSAEEEQWLMLLIQEDDGEELEETEQNIFSNYNSEEDTENFIQQIQDKIEEREASLVIETVTTATSNTQDVLSSTTNIIRSESSLLNLFITNNRLHTPIPGGDEEATIARGVWVSVLYGESKQSKWRKIPKYKGRSAGITIGADIEFTNTNDVIGAAYSNVRSKFKYTKKPSKTLIDGHIFSIYGQKELLNGFSLQALSSISCHYIKNNNHNNIGKYRNYHYSFEAFLNYKYRTQNGLYFIPNVGLEYIYSRYSVYKAQSNNIHDLTAYRKPDQLLIGSIGGKVIFKPLKINSISLIPSLHGSIENYFNSKSKKANAQVIYNRQVVEKTIHLPKQPKIAYNIGAGLIAKNDNIDISLEYNCHLQKKYHSHQVVAKLKIDF